jgi:hypothetical protein
MIRSQQINDPYQTDPCWLARRAQACIDPFNSHSAALAIAPCNSQRVPSHPLAHPRCTAKSSPRPRLSRLTSPAPAPKSP